MRLKSQLCVQSVSLPQAAKRRQSCRETIRKSVSSACAQELAMRRTELEKIDTLEDKIKQELTQLSDRQAVMDKEMAEFGSVSPAGYGTRR